MADWTPTWYTYNGVSIPTIRASDLSKIEFRAPEPEPWYGPEEARPVTPQTGPSYQYVLSGNAYGDLGNGSRNAFNAWSNNYQTTPGEDDNSFYVRLKTADKEGTNVRYVREGDYWVPQGITGVQGWDTNPGEPMDLVRAITAVAAPYAIGAGLLGGAGGATGGAAASAPGTMTTYGVLDTSMALPGTSFVSGAAGGAAGGIPGITGVEDLWPGATLSGPSSAMSPQVASYLGMSPEGYLLPAASAGGTSMLSQLGSSLLNNPSLLKGGAAILGGLLGQKGVDSGGSSGSGGWPDAPANPAPAMYGGNAAPPTFQTVGPTETERRMTQQYLPSLFSQPGLLTGMTSPLRRGLFGITRG